MHPFPNAMMMGSGYAKPALLTTGAGPGTITPNAAGYAVSGFADTAFAYLNAPKTSGKWWWELKYLGNNYTWVGIADDVTTAVSYGGYSSSNAGMRVDSIAQWIDPGWTAGAFTGWSGGAAVNGDIYNCALDMDSATKTFKIYRNNTLGSTYSWTGGAATIWPHFPFQSGPAAQINLGPAGCTYAPPTGYNYL